MTLCDVWKLFSCVFLWRWRSKDLVFFLKFERCEHRDDTSIVDGDQEGVKCCVERPSEEGAPLGWGIELCGSSSCVWGLRSLLNTEGILTLPMFLLSDGSLIWIWSASFDRRCWVVLSLSIIVKSFKFSFWVFCEDVIVSDGTGGLISMVSKSFFQGPVGFTYVFSCATGGWAFPVVDYLRFLRIFNGIFWIHE